MVGPDPSKWQARWLFDLRDTFRREDGHRLTQAEFAAQLVKDGIALGSVEGAKDPDETLRIRYGRWEKGTDAIPAGLIEAIAERYERELPSPPPPPESDLDRLVKALTRQAAALEERNRLDAQLISFLGTRLDTVEFRLGRVEEGQTGMTELLAEEIARVERLASGAAPTGSASEGNGSGAAGHSGRR